MAGYIFSKVLRVLVKYWRGQGHKVIMYLVDGISGFGRLVGFGFNGLLRQYFSVYRAVSQREGERGKKDR